MTSSTMATGNDEACDNRISSPWSYQAAFQRNIGILTEAQQQVLRQSRVAIAGMGGVGGVHLITLTRLGIGNFTIADADKFEIANFNRQYGAKIPTIDRDKTEVMAEEALAINPELDIRILHEQIGPDNVDEFLNGVDILVDGLDFYAIDARRLVFREARRRGIWSVTAGPHAYSTAWLVFDPQGMSFDEYFDLDDGMDDSEKTIAFAVGTVPSPLHLAYLDLNEYFRPDSKAGASVGFACHLASGIVGAQVVKILLDPSATRPAPYYFQFDAYRQMFRKGRLRGGNRHPGQRIKRWWLRRRLAAR